MSRVRIPPVNHLKTSQKNRDQMAAAWNKNAMGSGGEACLEFGDGRFEGIGVDLLK